MKRLFLVIIVLFCMSSLFAEKYTVTDFNGTVTYKSTNKFVKIVKGLELEEDDIVNVSLQSYLIITDTNGKEIVIKSASKGTVKELVLNSFILNNKKWVRCCCT